MRRQGNSPCLPPAVAGATARSIGHAKCRRLQESSTFALFRVLPKRVCLRFEDATHVGVTPLSLELALCCAFFRPFLWVTANPGVGVCCFWLHSWAFRPLGRDDIRDTALVDLFTRYISWGPPPCQRDVGLGNLKKKRGCDTACID